MLTRRASLAACAACAVTAFAAVSTTPTNHASPPATAVHPAPDGLRAILASFGTSDLANDLNADGRVDTTDLIVALSRMQGGNAGPIAPTAHRIDTIEPTIVGIGTKIRIRGSGLGTKANAAVVFGDSAIADDVEKHDSGEVIVSVPKGAPFGEGDVKVVVGAGDAVTLKEMAPAARLAALSRGAPATPKRVAVVNSFTTTPRNEAPFRLDTLQIVPHRVIVGLRDFEGFPTAITIAGQFNAQLSGFVAPGNSYILDIASSPADYAGLVSVMRRIKADPRVVDVCPDIVFATKAPEFATTDFVGRYAHNYNANLNGREDSWNMDRIQAPAAWNLIRRFGPSALGVPKIAILDTGIDVRAAGRHAEFTNVNVTQIAPATASQFNIAGTTLTLPTGMTDVPYTRGDASGHGTAVCSIIAARNNNVIPGTGGVGQPPADNGVNGVCIPVRSFDSVAHLQVHRGSSGNYPSEPSEPGDGFTLTAFLTVINYAGATDCKLMNASWGQPRPINPVGPNPPFGSSADVVRVGLRKLAKQLNQWRDDVMLCVAAGNEGLDPASYNGGEVTPFEDLNLNNVLDAGEDLDNDGVLDNGNYIGASLGTLPNVITVGAIIGSGLRDPASIGGSNFRMYRDDERWSRAFGPNSTANPYANASCWGTRRTPDAGQPADPTDLVVHLAAPGGDEILTASAAGFNLFQIGTQWYTWFGGTSAATPTVCGSAALLLTIKPDLTAPQIKQRLLDSSMPIMTKDKAGADLRWNTLKIGAAVRTLLVDEGRMANDAEWSGTSRIFDFANYDALHGTIQVIAHEIRQNPVTRRSEVFRQTIVRHINRTGTLAPLTLGAAPNGNELAYFENNEMKLYSVSGALEFQNYPGPANAVPASFGGSVRFSSSGVPYTYWTVDDPDCGSTIRQFHILAQNATYMRGQTPPAGHKYSWTVPYCLRPNNQQFYRFGIVTDYTMDPANPPCGDTGFVTQSGCALHNVIPGNPAIVLSVPPSDPLPHFDNPFWSHDGRLMGGRTSNNGLEARRITPDGSLAWNNINYTGQATVVWSPDGSEFMLNNDLYKRNNAERIQNWFNAGSVYTWSW